MGRWATDVMALACIAGGAVVGSGVTAALFASSGEREAQRVEVVCANEAPQVLVRLSAGLSATSTRTLHVRSHSACEELIHIDVAGLDERMDEARARMEEARVRVDEARGQIEAAEFRIQEVHEVREIARLRLEGVEEELVEVEELRAEELRAVLERVKADVERARASGGND